MPIKLRKKKLADGRESLFLDIHHNGVRSKEYLQIYLAPVPSPDKKNPQRELERKSAKEANAVTKQMADSIRAKREIDLNADEYDFSPAYKRNARFTDYFKKYSEAYIKKDRRKAIGAYNKFIAFLGDKHITFKQITEKLAEDFKEFLLTDKNLHGETPSVYFTQFKKVVKMAYKGKLLKDNPVIDVTISKSPAIHKDVLTMGEIQKLNKAYCGNETVKRAFLFSSLCGLRGADIRQLTWGHVKKTTNGYMIEMKQSKTGKDVKVNLNPDALELLGERKHKKDLIFKMPSQTAINKLLKNWGEKAGIDKHITYHVSRHSFGTNLVYNGVDVKTTSELLGHTSLNYTSLYVHIVDSMKEEGVNSLPSIFKK